MVARVRSGETTHAWIWIPQRGQMAIAEHGAGATIDGVRVQAGPVAADPTMWTAVVKKRYVPVEDRLVVDRFAARIGDPVEGIGCAGIEYIDLVLGRYDLLMYWRTLPWDHAPGSLLATEAGLKPSDPTVAPTDLGRMHWPPRRPPRDISGAASRSAPTLVPDHRTFNPTDPPGRACAPMRRTDPAFGMATTNVPASRHQFDGRDDVE